ncbi:MAG TPA: hypothetical protein VGR11_05605 [Solirubrobacteraceae bacterium]|nr:hypothetical protein [Solirubrobacteraceae bacterium]
MAEDEAREVVTGEGYAVGNHQGVAVGGKDGYVENDGHLLPSEESG